MERLCIKIHEKDNVAIAIRDLPKGTEIMDGVVTAEEIPQAHKIALQDIPEGGEVVRYGVVLGTMKYDMPKGGWINETNLVMAPAPDLDSMEFATNIVTDLPEEKSGPAKGGKLACRTKRDRFFLYGEAVHEENRRDDAMAMQYLIPDWKYDSKMPCLVR